MKLIDVINQNTFIENNVEYVKLRRICDGLNIDSRTQTVKLMKQNIGCFITTEDSKNNQQSQYCLTKPELSTWLHSIVNSNRIADKVRHEVSEAIPLLDGNTIHLTSLLEAQFGKYLQQLCDHHSVHLVQQFRVLTYNVDFFIPQKGLFVEYDEVYHNRIDQQAKDQERMKNIKSVMPNTTFIRVKQHLEYKGLLEVQQFLFDTIKFTEVLNE